MIDSEGNILFKKTTSPPGRNLLYNEGSIYNITFDTVGIFDEKGNLQKGVKLKGDEFYRYSRYVFNKGFFVALGKEYVILYNNSFSEYKRYLLSDLLKTRVDLKNIKAISSGDYIYILDIRDNVIYRLIIS